MEIRKATEGDIPAIIALLKLSLGETLMPKSEAYWRWKHISNPFGTSPVLLALDGNQVIGVRAFMRWAWTCGGCRAEAVRAVDTATHPDYQGRGIFSKLTKQLLEECKDLGFQIVFNTPNKKSLPGYLKMGWERAGKLPLRITLPNPVGSLAKTLKATMPMEEPTDDSIDSLLENRGLLPLLKSNEKFYHSKWHTQQTVESLKWRYKDVPVVKYHSIVLDEANCKAALIFRMKATKWGNEFRISDVFLHSEDSVPALRKLLKKKVQELKADFITTSGLTPFGILTGVASSFRLPVGPIVTVRNIDFNGMREYRGFRNWAPSVGDLELF